MGELGRAKDAVYADPCEDTLDRYAEVVREYLLADLDTSLTVIRQSVEERTGPEWAAAKLLLAWVDDILGQAGR